MRELPYQFARKLGNHPRECDPQERAPIRLSASRLQLIWDHAKRRPNVLTDSLACQKVRWTVAERNQENLYQNTF